MTAAMAQRRKIGRDRAGAGADADLSSTKLDREHLDGADLEIEAAGRKL